MTLKTSHKDIASSLHAVLHTFLECIPIKNIELNKKGRYEIIRPKEDGDYIAMTGLTKLNILTSKLHFTMWIIESHEILLSGQLAAKIDTYIKLIESKPFLFFDDLLSVSKKWRLLLCITFLHNY